MDTTEGSTDVHRRVQVSALIPYAPRQVGTETVQTVEGRDIHGFLGITKDYSSWVKRQIKRLTLIQGVDYTIFYNRGGNPRGGRPSIEYFFSPVVADKIKFLSRSVHSAQNSHFVYLIKHGRSQLYKVGMATDMDCRLRELQIGNPTKLTVAGLWQVEEARKLERFLHMQFAHLCIRGEWFRLPESQLQEFFTVMARHLRLL